MFDDEITSLFSLLGLLEPSEYFVTVDHSSLWQKHISWAKSGGEDLRQHITQRYASSMVFLSCLLAAQINVFFNSSKEITEMRACLETQRMGTLKYWIGVVIMSDICVTILALVNTYTLSKLIASISDSNAHAMLRSSIGSYVAVLPSRFTVAALYLFLLWIAMFIWEFFTGPIHYFFLLMVLLMFFHVIIPLSAFGRLIIHTGAMGRRPVLDIELEKELLPSGLHNSLLIRATDRKRKYNSSATDQYRKNTRSHHNPRGSTTAASASVPSSTAYGSNIPASTYTRGDSTSQQQQRLPRDITFGRSRNDHESDDLTMEGDEEQPTLDYDVDGNMMMMDNEGDHHVFIGGIDPEILNRNYSDGNRHRRMQTVDTVGSDNFFFPQAHILNSTTSAREIHEIVQQSMYLSASGADGATNAQSSVYSGATSSDPSQHQQQQQHPLHRSTISKVEKLPVSEEGAKGDKDHDETNPEKVIPSRIGGGNDDDDADEKDAVASPPSKGTGPETIATPAGLTRNVSAPNSTGHRRQLSSGGGSPRLMLPHVPSPRTQEDSIDNIHAGMRYPFPDTTPGLSRYSAPIPPPPPPSYGYYGPYSQPPQQQDPQQQQQQRHPLLSNAPPPSSASSSRPPPHGRPTRLSHRRRSGASRRSAGSILGFIPLPTPAEDELEEENAIRASLDMPLAPDLASQARLVEEQKHQQQHSIYSQPPSVASAWLAMHGSTNPPSSSMDRQRRRSHSAGHVKAEDATMAHDNRSAGGYRSNSRRNLMSTFDDGGGGHRSNNRHSMHDGNVGSRYRSNSRRNLMIRQPNSEEQPYRSTSHRNLMATINSHPDEEKEDEEEQQRRSRNRRRQEKTHMPEETTRLLSGQDDDDDEGEGGRRIPPSSYT